VDAAIEDASNAAARASASTTAEEACASNAAGRTSASTAEKEKRKALRFFNSVAVCERCVDLLVCSLPLHRHSYIGFILAFASSIHDKQKVAIKVSDKEITLES
jgi:hypothetical protein